MDFILEALIYVVPLIPDTLIVSMKVLAVLLVVKHLSPDVYVRLSKAPWYVFVAVGLLFVSFR